MRRRHKIVVAVLCGYVLLHFGLSRHSESRVKAEWGIENAYLYVPVSPTMVAQHEGTLGVIHWTLSGIFYPVWRLDNLCTGIRPIRSMPLMSLSGDEGAGSERK